MQWLDSVWTLKRGELRLFESEDSVSVVTFDSLPRPDWREDPEAFAQRQRNPENMGYFELARWIVFKEKSGADATKERVELQLKIAFPFACFMMVMIAVPIASTPKRAGFARSFGIAFGIAFVYFSFARTMHALGTAGDVPPLVAAWAMNAFFFAVGLMMFGLVRK
jgi:lipopolysaccharide export system permease protein